MTDERLAYIIQQLEASLARSAARTKKYHAEGRPDLENITYGETLAYEEALGWLRREAGKEAE